MKPNASRPTVVEGIGVALVGSIAGAGAFAMLSVVLGSLGLFRLLIAVLALGYVLYLLVRSRERVGRVSVILVWFALAGANLILVGSPLLYVVVHLAVIWLVRALYFYQGVLPALMDLGLMATALLAGVWVGDTTHSLFLSLWCFFLVQALFALIPSSLTRPSGKAAAPAGKDDFERAHRSAQAALRKLTTTH
jgi:hypothetical protein